MDLPPASEIFTDLSKPIDPIGSGHRGRAPVPTEATAFPSRWQLLDDVEVMALPDPEYLVEGMLPRRSCGVLYGPPGGAKTTLIAKLATAIAARPEFFGH